MRKLLLLTAITAGFLSSCSEDDFTTQSTVDVNTIAFATNKAMTSTRSAETITSINKFTVSAVNNDNTTYYSNEDYIYDSASRTFKSSTPHYWPTTGTLSFYAISDAGSYTVDANNVPQFTYTNWPAEKDLVAATVKAGEKEIPYPLTFRHLTSQICVSAEAENKTEELTYKLTAVRMTAPSTGTYTFADATGGVGTWVIDNTKTSEYSYEDALPMSFRQNGQIELSSCYWNILPVTDGKLYFKIEYQVLQNGKVIADYTSSNYKECTIDAPGLVAGMKYCYNFILTRGTNEEITFSTTVTDWSEGGSANQTLTDPLAESNPVDLGLPSGLKWAKGNLGSSKETDEGLYFAWGETTGYAKDSGHSFSSANYTASSISSNLTLDQDAVNVRLGGTWRMPTHDEFTELFQNTTHYLTTINGVSGYRFENKSDASKYIFMPAAGYYSESTLNSFGTVGYYWSSTIYNGSRNWLCNFGPGGCCTCLDYVTNGMQVRGVCE